MNVFHWNARARNTHVEATLNHPFPAQVAAANGLVSAEGLRAALRIAVKQDRDDPLPRTTSRLSRTDSGLPPRVASTLSRSDSADAVASFLPDFDRSLSLNRDISNSSDLFF